MPLGQRTKSEPVGTARRILEHAGRVFNARGVGAVGMREIARDLGLSPGNLSYHFPTKERLVAALIEQAHADNNDLVAAAGGTLDFPTVDHIVRTIMRRDLEHGWVMRDSVGLLVALPGLRPLHQRLQRARDARIDHLIGGLIDANLLDRATTTHLRPVLRQQILTQVFFWLPAAIIAAPERDPAERLDAHARAALALFRGYCTPAGRRQLDALLGATPVRASKRGRTSRARARG